MKRIMTHGYIRISVPSHPKANKRGQVYEHFVVAERALGRYLPNEAEVHHVNEVKSDNLNTNLVICENRAFHKLLHARERALKACGNPNWRPCSVCGVYDDPAKFQMHRSSSGRHRECGVAYMKEWHRKRKLGVPA